MEDKIADLQQQIDLLANDIHHSQSRLVQLQRELDALRKTDDQPVLPAAGPVLQTKQPATLENFLGLRFIHLAGIVILVIGLSIGVKYAIDKQLISELTRVLLAYLAGGLLYFFSWRLKKNYHLFSAILFSGAMASLYFTTYAAYTYYQFFPFPVAFGVMILVTAFTVYNAIQYNRQEIAVLGMTGAYAIPFFISANKESILLFFSYIFFINAGILFLSFRKRWTIMGQIAMYLTWGLFFGAQFFRPSSPGDTLTGSIFMVLFYVLFLVNAFASRITRKEILAAVDIQQLLVNNIAVCLAAVFLYVTGDTGFGTVTGGLLLFVTGLCISCRIFFRLEDKLLQSLCMQAVALAVLFIFLQWQGIAITLLWIVLAVGLFIAGILLRRSWPRLAALLLMGATLAKLVIIDSSRFSTVEKIAGYLLIGTLLLVLSFLYQKYKGRLFGNE